MRHLFLAVCTASLTGLIVSNAWALDPQTTAFVPEITLQVPGADRLDEETAFVGIDGCRQLLANDSLVSATFQTTLDTTVEESGETRFDSAFSFFVDRDSGSAVNCESGDVCNRVGEEDINRTSSSIEIELPITDLTELDAVEDCVDFDREYFIRVRLTEIIGGTDIKKADARIIIDTIRPPAPSNVSATTTENVIRVEFTPPEADDIRRFAVYYSQEPFSGSPDDTDVQRKFFGDDESNAGEVKVELPSDSTVYVAVATQDETGNVSDFSSVVESQVIQTIDFWELYKQRGGAEEGGCSTASGKTDLGFLGLVLLAGLWFGRIRRRRCSDAGAAAIVVAAGAALMIFMAPSTASAETPIYGNFALKLGGFYPAIDDEFGGAGPFQEIFGAGTLLYGELEVDGYIWDDFGKAGFGLHAGYSSVEGNALTDADEEVPDTTSFTVFPLRVSAIYRYDYSAIHHGIPLVPVLSAGLDYYLWSISDSDGGTAEFEGQDGDGGKWGWHVTLGLQLLLDFIDPSTAAVFDLNWGVNNSYLFAEYMITRIDGFGDPGLDLSDEIVMFGVTFEY